MIMRINRKYKADVLAHGDVCEGVLAGKWRASNLADLKSGNFGCARFPACGEAGSLRSGETEGAVAPRFPFSQLR
jgi:hypothetical protein